MKRMSDRVVPYVVLSSHLLKNGAINLRALFLRMSSSSVGNIKDLE